VLTIALYCFNFNSSLRACTNLTPSLPHRHKGISAFIVPMDAEGFSLGAKEDKLGIRASEFHIIFKSVEIKDDVT
jgi:alkylation response protein AidB-like acyl-CoA dehydrogenase